ncbi:MAG: exo-alpha-sialidase [Sphingobacteriaceae bacterium]|nr:exo-alpha-sialidase [Cytophagaceae bacterium]
MPALFADKRGTLHLTFGRSDTIFYAASTDGGLSFTKPVAAGILPDLVAGAKRGPQVAANGQFVVITAVNQAGNLFAYRLDRPRGTWQAGGALNDVSDVAKEGFQGLAVGGDGTFHAAWLDLRGDRHNKIAGTISTDGGMTWKANRVLYRSPDSTVCECCQVSVAAQGQHVYVQFRNFLNGSRDLHLLHSADGGRTYEPAQKLGQGTWKLKACPMDGGRVALTPDAQPLTVWRREGTIYFCKPGQLEQAVAEGRNCTLTATANGPLLAWETRGTLFVKPSQREAVAVGEGQLPNLAATGSSAVCAWEQTGQVVVATLPLN